MKQFLLDVLDRRLTSEQRAWLQQAVDASAASRPDRILSNYTSASRRLGKQALRLDPEEKAGIRLLNPVLNIDNWGADEAGRAAILLSIAEGDWGEYVKLVQQCYDFGDSREQQSWLRGLSLLPNGQSFLQTAIDACRTNIVPMLEAIACENPYPSTHFPQLNFNQMVMKCLFNGIAMSRIVGLETRLNPELTRMADHYTNERRAAGRDIPKDIHMTHDQYSRRDQRNENV